MPSPSAASAPLRPCHRFSAKAEVPLYCSAREALESYLQLAKLATAVARKRDSPPPTGGDHPGIMQHTAVHEIRLSLSQPKRGSWHAIILSQQYVKRRGRTSTMYWGHFCVLLTTNVSGGGRWRRHCEEGWHFGPWRPAGNGRSNIVLARSKNHSGRGHYRHANKGGIAHGQAVLKVSESCQVPQPRMRPCHHLSAKVLLYCSAREALESYLQLAQLATGVVRKRDFFPRLLGAAIQASCNTLKFVKSG